MTGIEQRVARIAGSPVVAARPVGGGSICRTVGADLADGRRVFAKQAPTGRPGMAATEAAGLRWLAQGGAAVPDVVGHDDEVLVLAWVPAAPAAPATAYAMGRMLAVVHRSGAPSFGAPPPGAAESGWIGSAAMAYADEASWPTFFADCRIRPYSRTARSVGALTGEQGRLIDAVCDRIERIAGAEVPPARLHGDLWGGNLLIGAGGGMLIDPAAHGGHPETDLAMLLLFPPPHARDIIAGYESVSPLAEGWRDRIELHQLSPLLVHAVLFGGGYGAAAAAAAGRLLAR